MYQLTGTSYSTMPFKAVLYAVLLFQAADFTVGQEAVPVANCTSQSEGEDGGLANSNCTFSEDQKAIVGDNCISAADCFEGLQCTPNNTCACPEGCDYITHKEACSCGSDWSNPNIIVFLTVGVPINALLWCACFYRTSKDMKRNDGDDGNGSRSTIVKAETVDSLPLTPAHPSAPGSLLAVYEAGSVARPPPIHPQWWTQATSPPNNLPLNAVPPPPTYYPPRY